jgi:uncharacterized protein (DUF1810 family)
MVPSDGEAVPGQVQHAGHRSFQPGALRLGTSLGLRRSSGRTHGGPEAGPLDVVVFPQLRGLGRSPTAALYGIGSLDEARAYLVHPVLGPRVTLCTEALLAIEERSLHAMLGWPDDLKFCSP